MRYLTLLTAVVSLGVLGACAHQPTSPRAVMDAPGPMFAAVTPAERTEFEGFINFCGESPPGGAWVTPGGVLHLREGGNFNQWVTGNPLVDGPEENVVDLNLNFKTGRGVVHLVVTVMPDAVAGTWEIQQSLKVPSFLGHGVGYGTGELHGMTIKFTTEPASGISVCNSELGRAKVQGVILSPASTG